MIFSRRALAVLLALLPSLAFAQAQPAALPLKELAQKAVLNNPDVLARWHVFREAVEEVDVARGGFFPRVDLSAGVGRESFRQPGLPTLDYTRRNYGLSLNQMLFDGFATRSEVKRLGKAKLVRYFELLDASENIALEAARAYHDVMRYRDLVRLAEENYVQHKATHDQLLRRAQSGVGRRVDMEQAGSRLALAESNLTTELANLHDVMARYQRITGELPPPAMTMSANLGEKIPATETAAMERALQHNPALLAALENVEAAQHDIDTRRAAFMPRLDLRASTSNTHNYLGMEGDRRNNVVELVLNYNLFNGGSDMARQRQYAERRNTAQDQRLKVCHDTRQVLSIAYNDTRRLKEQEALLSTQVALLEKTRNAYRDQFNVGQRTLLDLLDTENELLNARRAAVNVRIDMAQAYLRTHASMGSLLEFLGLQKLDTGPEPEGETLAKSDAVCGADLVSPRIDRAALDARAATVMEQNARGARSASPQPASGPEAAVVRQVESWAAAWSRKDYNAYAAFYAPGFVPEGGLSREDWAKARQARIANPGHIRVGVSDLKVRLQDNKSIAEFRQDYSSDTYHDVTRKVLEFVQIGDQWLIGRETQGK